MKFSLNKLSDIKAYRKTLGARLDSMQNAFLKQTYDNLQIFTPVRTGRLRSGYKLDYLNKCITNDTPYLWFVNDGTRFQTGQHFVELSYQTALHNFKRKSNK